jgi:hypothetical protein
MSAKKMSKRNFPKNLFRSGSGTGSGRVQKSDPNAVVEWPLVPVAEEYVHRIGRTGRVGNNGEAVSFFDMEVDNKIIKVR